MHKWLLLLILINIPFNTLAAWQENNFKLDTSYKVANFEQLELYDSRSTFQLIELSTEKVSLFDGFGVRTLGEVSPFVIKQDELSEDKGTNHKLAVEGILFLSQTNELTINLTNMESTELFDNRLNNILLGISEELTSKSNQASANITLGKDKSFFYLNFQHSFNKTDKESFVTGQAYNELEVNNSSVEVLWRQSESTLWGMKAEKVESEQQLFGVKQNFDISNYYLSSVTDYFASSQLAVHIGSSNIEGKKQFSWDVKHKTHVSQSTNFSLRSYRKFDQVLDNTQEEDLNTHHEVNFSYQPIDYVETSVHYYKEERKRGDVKVYERESLAVAMSVTYDNSWKLSAGYVSERITNHFDEQKLSQNSIQLSITKVLI